MKTIKVRIAVIVNSKGEWCSAGWNTDEETLKECVSENTDMFTIPPSEGRDTFHWITAEIPLPTSPDETPIIGTVEPDDGARRGT